jgi:hypothetical protein
MSVTSNSEEHSPTFDPVHSNALPFQDDEDIRMESPPGSPVHIRLPTQLFTPVPGNTQETNNNNQPPATTSSVSPNQTDAQQGSVSKPTTESVRKDSEPKNTQSKNLLIPKMDNICHIDNPKLINTNINTIDNIVLLIAQYDAKINALHVQQLKETNLDKVKEINALIQQFEAALEKLKNKENPEKKMEKITKPQKDTQNTKTIPTGSIPFFQLEDDANATKTDGKTSYESAETFLTAFENIISGHSMDINLVWKKYLPHSFLFSKNANYIRFYNTHIGVLPEDTKWEIVKDEIGERYGDFASNANKLKRFASLRQKREEPLRDYFDRYLEAMSRLPFKPIQSAIDVVIFLKSLQPTAQKEVEKSLKKNITGVYKTIYPPTLDQLFAFLKTNIGDIQEALYLSYTTKENTKKSESAKYESNKLEKRKIPNHEVKDDNKKPRQFRNPCEFCKLAEFSFDHLQNCIPYLKSDKYRQRIIQRNDKWNNKKSEKVTLNSKGKIETKNFNLNDIYSDLEQDIPRTFNKVSSKFKFNKHVFKVQSKNFKSNDENVDNTTIFKKINDNHIMCYKVNELSESEVQSLSPYSPAIIINNEKIIAMCDSGSPISIINKRYNFEDKSIFDNLIPSTGKFSFIDRNVTVERTGKTQALSVSYKGKPTFTHSFEVVEMPEERLPLLIGRDLLPQLGITYEGIAYNFNEVEETIFDDSVNHDKYIPNVSKACSDSEYDEFMQYLELYFQANKEINIQELCPLNEALVHLKTKAGEVANTKQYPVAYALQPVVREQIKKWYEDRTIEPAKLSGYNNPLTLVAKPNDSKGNKKWRVCLDTRRLNNILEDTANVNTPMIDDIFYELRQSKIFGTFDVSSAFHRLKIAKEDRHKLTFTFEGKSWHFRGGCFGIKTLPCIFQNLMETIFHEMKDFVSIYMDDVVVHSKDLASHKIHCQKVIEALTKNNLPINIEKTHLARNSVFLLGFCLSEQGKSIDPRRLTNIDEWEKPKTPKALMKFCGWVSYVRSHLPNASGLTAPLDQLKFSVNKTIKWTPEMDEHYDSIINIIKANIRLSHPDLNHPFILQADASNYAVASCLLQEYIDPQTGTKIVKYIGFASKSLNAAQRNYSVTRKELLALTTGLTKFHKFLYGSKPFVCRTDHRALSYLFTTKHLSTMMTRYIEVILNYPNMNVVWIPGVENVMSDKLSRLFPTPQDNVILDKEEKKLFPQLYDGPKCKKGTSKKRKNKQPTTLEKDPDCINQYYTSIEERDNILPKANHYVKIKRWTLKTVHDLLDEQVAYLCPNEEDLQINFVQNMDTSYVIPPEQDRPDILKRAHEFGHFGGEAIVQRIRKDEGMNWPHIMKEALEVVKQCSTCQKFVIQKTGYNPLKPLYCYSPGFHYQMDLCGPFPCTKDNNTYIMVLLDVATRFIILRSIPDKSAKTVAKELISIFSLVGYPRIINSDRGAEWKNQILDLVCEAMKIDKRLSTAYYPQSNGGAERAVQNTKKLLSKLILGNSEDNWDMMVNSVQLMINCKVSKRTQTSPFNLMFARKMTNEYPLLADPSENIDPMDTDELLKRIEYMSDIVFPAIKERTDVYNRFMKQQFDDHHRLIDFPVGSFVVVKKKGIRKSLTPIYEGPYEVVRKTASGNYTLRDEMGLLIPRDFTPSELKLVSQDALVALEEIYEFDGIVDHRGEAGHREYKVRWKNYTAAEDSWITSDMFTDPQAITNYWKRIKGSVSKKDSKQLDELFAKEKSGPSFELAKTGALLQTIEQTITDNVPSSSSSSNQPNRKQVPRRTSHRTKTVNNNPASKAFTRSTRGCRTTFKPAIDKTRYRK